MRRRHRRAPFGTPHDLLARSLRPHNRPPSVHGGRLVSSVPTSIPVSTTVPVAAAQDPAVTGLLIQRCLALERMVHDRDAIIAGLIAANRRNAAVPTGSSWGANSSGCPDAPTDSTFTSVDSDEALEAALRSKASVIALQRGRSYTLLPQPFQLADCRTMIFGCGATLECSLRCVRTTLDLVDVTLVAPGCLSPVVDASGSSDIRATRSVFRNGRDGVFLSDHSHALLENCRIEANRRGVFEGHGCHATVSHCAFSGNWFHAVLLHRPSHQRARAFTAEMGNTFASSDVTRGDVALQYNPMTDRYDDVVRDGQHVVLTEVESTTELVDPAW